MFFFGIINVHIFKKTSPLNHLSSNLHRVIIPGFLKKTSHSPFPMAELATGDATARQRAHVALSAGASLEEVEEARQLLDTSEEQVGGSSWQGGNV